MCVCVCVCVCLHDFGERVRELQQYLKHNRHAGQRERERERERARERESIQSKHIDTIKTKVSKQHFIRI